MHNEKNRQVLEIKSIRMSAPDFRHSVGADMNVIPEQLDAGVTPPQLFLGDDEPAVKRELRIFVQKAPQTLERHCVGQRYSSMSQGWKDEMSGLLPQPKELFPRRRRSCHHLLVLIGRWALICLSGNQEVWFNFDLAARVDMVISSSTSNFS